MASCDRQYKWTDKYRLEVYKRPFKQTMKGKKILLYGDSISSTDYIWYKMFMEQLTGAEVYNAGFSGYTTEMLAKDEQLQRIFDYNPDLIICLVGGNDAGEEGTVGTYGATGEPMAGETNPDKNYSGRYFIQAVSHMMRKIDKHYYNFRAGAGLKGSETEQEKEALLDSVKRTYLVFCTPLPQKRENRFNPFSDPDNWQRKRDAIVESCYKYKIHCIDLFNLCAWNFSQEPFWKGPTDKVTNNGIYTMDGLHPNKYGYEYISRVICGELGL